jgi:hypothetical protein
MLQVENLSEIYLVVTGTSFFHLTTLYFILKISLPTSFNNFQSPSLPDAPSISSLQIQRFLCARTLDYEESQADLRLRVPC